ncbi:hypothetical protein PGQ11_006181 [Apiospora arundinis]|uniref:Ankyrin repeat protein n=1 Tax=Apiospora arundinis TaxID=335852 RepID=A0ABR2ISF0_9PEZI
MSTQNDNPGDDAPQINAAPQTDDTPQTSALALSQLCWQVNNASFTRLINILRPLDESDGLRILMYAAHRGNLHTIRLFLDHWTRMTGGSRGPDLNESITASHFWRGERLDQRMEIWEPAMFLGLPFADYACPYIPTEAPFYYTLLVMAIVSGHHDTAKLLVDNGANVNRISWLFTRPNKSLHARPINFVLDAMLDVRDPVIMGKWIDLLQFLLRKGAIPFPNRYDEAVSALGQSVHPHIPFRVTSMLVQHWRIGSVDVNRPRRFRMDFLKSYSALSLAFREYVRSCNDELQSCCKVDDCLKKLVLFIGITLRR